MVSYGFWEEWYMDLAYAIKILKEIRSEWHKPIRSKNVSNNRLSVSAYTTWAFDEIYFWVLADKDSDPILAIQRLMELSDHVASTTTNEDKSVMFYVLCDICEEVLEVWKSMGMGVV